MQALVLVGLGSALGGMARFALTSWLDRPLDDGGFPWGTLAVNCLGCLAIGAVAALASRPWLLQLLIPGVLGGFTTFSAFGWQTAELCRHGRWGVAAAYAGVSLLGGVLAVWLGAQTRPAG